MNPLYGRDTYNGSFTRPAGAPRTTSTTSPTSALGLRAQYALSSVLVARPAPQHALPVSAGRLARVEPADAEPRAALRVLDARTGRRTTSCRTTTRRPTRSSRRGRLLVDRALDQSGPQQLRTAPRVCLHPDAGHGHPRRLRRELRALQPRRRRRPPADQRAAGRQRGHQPGGPDGRRRSCRPSRAIRPASPIRRSSIRCSRTSPTCRGTSTRARCRAGTSRCSASCGATCCSTSPMSATAPTTCCCSPTTTRRRRTTPPGRFALADRRPIAGFADITYAFNGGKSRYKALQTKFEWRVSRDVRCSARSTLSQTKDNGSQSLENSNGNFPAPQDFRNLDADFGLLGLPPAVQQHHELRVGAAVRHGTVGRLAGRRRADRRLAARRHQPVNAGEPVTLTYTPGATFVVSGIAQDFRGANNYRPTSPAIRGVGDGPHDHELVQPRLRHRADRSEPAVRQRRPQHRARAEVLADRPRRLEAVRARRAGPVRVPARGVQPAEPRRTSARRTATAARARSVRSPRPSIRGSCNSGFKLLW